MHNRIIKSIKGINSLGIVLCLLLLLNADLTAQKNNKLPNIIVFMVDDMGWQDCSEPFWDTKTASNILYHTPNMEQMAKQGMKFTNAYAAPVCSPSRVSLITGMNAVKHKVTNWVSPQQNSPTDNNDTQFGAPIWNHNGVSTIANMPHTAYATALPSLLKDAGYYTVHVGKAHWGAMGTPASNPRNLGFMVSIAGTAAGHPSSFYGKNNYGNISGKANWNAVPDLQEYYGQDIHLTEALTLEAIKSIETPIQNNQPFFLNLSHYAIHQPIVPHHKYYQKYLDKGLDSLEASYASMIEGMDASLGALMKYLVSKKVDNNTLILFISDNGGLTNPKTRTGEPFTQNNPLRSGKGSVYEGGIRVPMLVKWPAVVKQGGINKLPVSIEDIFPTFLQMAGVKNAKTQQTVDGISFLPILKNSIYKNDERIFVWHFPHKWTNVDGPGINFFSAIRQGNWKLVYNIRTKSSELYNLQNNIGEKNSVATTNLEKAKQLENLLLDYLKNNNASMPIEK